MKKYTILDVQGKKFVLRDDEGKEFKIEFNLYDLEVAPAMGDMLTFDENLLDERSEYYYPFYDFGDIKSPYGREIDTDNHPELMILNLGGKEYRLKRFWG